MLGLSFWCRTLAISICRREKYLAKMTTRASLTKSDGWKEKTPRENQLAAPRETCPMRKRSDNMAHEATNKPTETHVFLKKRKSIKLHPKKTPRAMTIQMICRMKKLPPAPALAAPVPATIVVTGPPNELIVTNQYLFSLRRGCPWWYRTANGVKVKVYIKTPSLIHKYRIPN